MAGKLPPVELTVQSQNNNRLVLNSFTLGTICVCVCVCVYERETQSKREVQKQESVQFSSWVPKGMTFSLNILPALGRMKIRSLLDRTNKRKDRKVALGASSPPLFLLLTLKWAFSSPSPHQHPSYLSAPRHCYPRSYCLSCLLTRV